MWVVKLGGSLAESAHLPRWLEALSQTAAIIVPGGGAFADTVRNAQARWQFDETTAHHMAILAMRQYGLMLAGLCPSLLKATTFAELTADTGRAKVWLPLPEMLDEAGIPATWNITSDSLAAWLAGRLGAENLLLVKSAAGITSLKAKLSLSCAELVKLGWVDPVFPEYAAKNTCQHWLCGPDGHIGLALSLSKPARYFIRVAI
jgi:aspartokinase-like uncharacterized kinase